MVVWFRVSFAKEEKHHTATAQLAKESTTCLVKPCHLPVRGGGGALTTTVQLANILS